MVERNRRGTPTVYRGVQMRSRLEAMVASWLDNRRIPWEYEPECFADELGQYYPDFLLHPIRTIGDKDASVYLEVKPGDLGGLTEEVVLRRMQCIWSAHPRAFLTICSPHYPYAFPLRWSHHDTWDAQALWIECARCGYTGIDTLERLQAPFARHGIPVAEPWQCPTCQGNRGFHEQVPWNSAEYHAMVNGRRLAG